MKKSIFLMAALAFLGAAVCMADAWDDAIHKAQALKKTGDFVGAAEATPRTLCKAIYYWNAAAQTVGHKDVNGDWQINAKLTPEQKAEGLRLLKLSSDNLTAAGNEAGLTAPDDGTCTGVTAADVQSLIDAVTACINGNCK
jgi:hypothetical protein